MKNILITGATGYIGLNLIKRLLKMECQIHVIVRETSNLEALRCLSDDINYHYYDGALNSMTRVVEQSKPDVVVHLASFFTSEHSRSDVDQLVQSNITFGLHLLESMKLFGIENFINTGSIWQNFEGADYNPVNLYAATKEAFERLAQYYVEVKALRMITLKIYDTYGPNDKRNKIINLFCKMSPQDEPLDMSPGEQLIGLVYIDDVVDAFIGAIDLLEKNPNLHRQTYYLTPNAFMNLKEVAKIYEDVYKYTLKINWGYRSYRSREVMNPFVGERLPGWLPKIDLREGLTRIKDQYNSEIY